MIDVKVNLKEVQKIKDLIDKENSYARQFVPTRARSIAFKIQGRAKKIIPEKEHIITRSLGRSISVTFNQTKNNQWNAKIGTWLEYGGKVERLPVGSYMHQRGEHWVTLKNGKRKKVKSYFWAQGGGGYLRPAAAEVFAREKE